MFVSVAKKLEDSGLSHFINCVENVNILTSSSSTCVLHWQPCDKLVFNKSNGFKPERNTQLEIEALDFIKTAVGKLGGNGESGLVLTPEYSFPYDILKEIASTSELWPKQNQLWCLSMQGIALHDFENFIETYSHNKVSILIPSISVRKQYINSIIYVVSNGKQLLLMPQLKFQHAADRDMEYEAPHMSIGSEVLLLANSNEQTCFLSLICADMLNDTFTKLINSQVAETHLPNLMHYNFTIFNPQLNIKPFHKNYNVTIGTAIEFMHRAKFRFIALNWSAETNVCSATIKHGGSALLSVADNLSPVTKKRSQRNGIIIRNPKSKFLMACFPPCKHILMYTLAPDFNSGQACAVGSSPQFSPLAVFVQEKDWVVASCLCQIDWKWIDSIFKLFNSNHFCLAKIDDCPSLDVKSFFQTFFVNGFGGDDYQISEPYIKDLKEPSVDGKREKLERLAKFIETRKLPTPLMPFADTACWHHKKKNRNLQLCLDDGTKYHVRLLHEDSKAEAVAAYANAKKSEEEDSTPPIYVYHPTESGYQVYPNSPRQPSEEIFPKEMNASLIYNF